MKNYILMSLYNYNKYNLLIILIILIIPSTQKIYYHKSLIFYHDINK